MSAHETYLGDGLYASFDGFMITLRAPREHGDHWVGLEPDVMLALRDYLDQTLDKFRPKTVFTCPSCGQQITDGRPCGCGAQT